MDEGLKLYWCDLNKTPANTCWNNFLSDKKKLIFDGAILNSGKAILLIF